MLYSEFVLSAKHFLEISNSINDGWSLKTYGDNVYLVKCVTQCLKHDNLETKELNDSTVALQSDDQCVDDPPLSIRKWEYHILYSLSYQVPVIYFNVWKSTGQLLSLDELLKAVNPNFKDSVFKNRWFTLTQQEHPFLFKPFFYFHPCHTEDFLNCFNQSQCNMLITWLSSIGQMDESCESLEGFLCPDCLANFKTAVQLTSHYQDKHSDDFLKSVKEIYGKAKKKILFKELSSASESEESGTKSFSGYRKSEINDEIGGSKNHTDFFKLIRTNKMEHYAAQTNNLIIRLEKLLINLPTDPVKRKVHEQEVVPWLNEKDVKLCPGCAKSFNLLRRKHHCRLCGSIMCNECTFLLQLDTARKMTNSLITSNSPSEDSPPGNPSPKEKIPVKKLLRSPSGASVQSVLSLDLTSEAFFRICEYCYRLLDMRQKLKEVRNQKPIICQFYEKMRGSVDEINSQFPIYRKMYKSLSIGETNYNLSDAELVRVKILKAAENIDLLSNKIAVLGQNSENPPTGNQLLLQKAVRNAAMLYLKENIVSLPSLPKEEQIKEAQNRRRLEIARRIEEENRWESFDTVEADVKSNKSGIPNNLKSQSSLPSTTKEVLVEDGWTPEVSQKAVGIISDHPVIQQINIIKGYIKQAELANRLGEVATLQENLRDLEEEFWRQTKESYAAPSPN